MRCGEGVQGLVRPSCTSPCVCVCACVPAFHHVQFLPVAEPKDSLGGWWIGGGFSGGTGCRRAPPGGRGWGGLSRACWDIINTGPRGNPGDGRRSQPTRCCLLVDRRAVPRTGTAGWRETCANQPSILTPLSSSFSTTSPVDPISTSSHVLSLLSHGCLHYFHAAAAAHALCRTPPHTGGTSPSPVIKKRWFFLLLASRYSQSFSSQNI